MRPRVVFVAAMARDRTIAKDGDLPWHYPEDLRHFKETTTGTTVVMGRKTLDSLGKGLPARENLVLTRHPEDLRTKYPDVTPVTSLQEAFDLAEQHGAKTISLAGGGEVFREAMPYADEILLTLVPEDGGGDVFFPEIDEREWRVASREPLGRCELVRYARR